MTSTPPHRDTSSLLADSSNAEAEEQTLLTGRIKRMRNRGETWRQMGLLVWAVVATSAVIFLGVLYQRSIDGNTGSGGGGGKIPKGKRNLVFMVSDGMGPTSLSMTRSYLQQKESLHFSAQLQLDTFLIGQSRTRSANSLVTDSAAGATAFSCGFKANNSAISVLPDGSPCGTVLEAAKKAGYMTGLVVTTRITDATPACFSAHVNSRGSEDRIAEQQLGEYPLGRMVDLILGGGRCHFLPKTAQGSCRLDDRDLVSDAQKKGWQYISDRAGFDGLKGGKKAKLPLLGLFAETDIPFKIDRDENVYPSLNEMARVALNILSEATKDSDKGFFLLVEGSRIDHAGHDNDPAAQVREVIEYSDTFKEISDFLRKSDVEGIVVGTSDHETGGLAAARQIAVSYPDYLWYPTVLMNATHSAQYLSTKYADFKKSAIDGGDSSSEQSFLRKEIFEKGLGILDPTDEELKRVREASNVVWALSETISKHAQIGWSTHGHSAADVNIYSNSPDVAKKLAGNHENTEIGKFLAEYLDVDVDAVTKELVEKGTGPDGKVKRDGQSWMGPPMEEQLREEGHNLDGGPCYHDYGHPGAVRRDAHFH